MWAGAGQLASGLVRSERLCRWCDLIIDHDAANAVPGHQYAHGLSGTAYEDHHDGVLKSWLTGDLLPTAVYESSLIPRLHISAGTVLPQGLFPRGHPMAVEGLAFSRGPRASDDRAWVEKRQFGTAILDELCRHGSNREAVGADLGTRIRTGQRRNTRGGERQCHLGCDRDQPA